MTTVNILSIEAWRTPDGWQWNNWFNVGTIDTADIPEKPRAILRYMREAGYLTPASAGEVAIEDDGYNVVIVAKGTREPLLAIAYGEAL